MSTTENMRFFFKGLDVDAMTRDYIEKKLSTLDKFIENILKSEVEIDLDKKGKFTNLGDYTENANDYLSKIVAQVWNIYENKKTKENSLDFDDLLVKATKLLKDNLEIRKIYQDRWEYIHIEFL